MVRRLFNALSAARRTDEAFSDAATLRHMLRFEAALAHAAASAELIPRKHADTIVEACDPALYDPAPLAEAARRSATLTVPVVKALTEEVRKRDPAAAGYVHWGATSQDVLDTAMVLQLGEALLPLVKDLGRIVDRFARLAQKHRATPMLGRTLLQPATPVALGQKIAGWAHDIDRAKRRLADDFLETHILQFGGASGSLSALGSKAQPVMIELARRLGLKLPPAPWFTQRVRVAALAQDIALAVGTLGKAARDMSLMMQFEVSEAAEPSAPGRGGSSTMPHKRNPVGAIGLLACAKRAPGLVATMLAAMIQEHERGAGGWQAEWDTMLELLRLAGSAAAIARELLAGLEVHADKMRGDMDLTGGLVMSESVAAALSRSLGRSEAQELVEKAARRSVDDRRAFRDVLLELPEVANGLGPERLDAALDPAGYLGVTAQLIDRALGAHRAG